MNEIRHALRALIRKPRFTVLAVAIMALGIGANTAIFGIINTLVLKPRPVGHPEELTALGFINSSGDRTMMNISRPILQDFKDHTQGFSGVVGIASMRLMLQTEGKKQVVPVEMVTGNYFTTLGVQPALGRLLIELDDQSAESQVAVLRHGFWQEHFNGDPAVVGRTLRLNDQLVTVAGVAAEGFEGMDEWAPDLWLPTSLEPVMMAHTVYRLIGRLAPGVGMDQATADIQRTAGFIAEKYGGKAPPGYERYGLFNLNNVRPIMLPAGYGQLSPFFSQDNIWKTYWMLTGVSGLVLLIACANLSNLLLVRSLRRRREIAVRMALGASRWQVARQTLIESVMLAALGGLLGLALAQWLNELLLALKPAHVRFMADLTIDYRVLGFAVLAALAAGLIASLFPVWWTFRQDAQRMIAAGGGTTFTGGRPHAWKNAFVSGQLAACLVLLCGAGLCLRSLAGLLAVEPGFDGNNVAIASLDISETGNNQEARANVARELAQHIHQLPGVRAVGFSNHYPLDGGTSGLGIKKLDGYEIPPGEMVHLDVSWIGPGYFAAMGIPIVRGQELDASAVGHKRRVALVNESFVRRYWRGQNPLERHIKNGPRSPVIGVVKDTRAHYLWDEPTPQVYFQAGRFQMSLENLVVRTAGVAGPDLQTLRSKILAFDPRIEVRRIQPMAEIIRRSLGVQRFTLTLLAGFALVALLLCAMGTYALNLFVVGERTREIGIRMALGAGSEQVLGFVLRRGVRTILLGVLAGLAAAAAMTPLISDWLHHISPNDPLVFAGSILLLILVALTAAYLPARRATRIQPMEALRTE